MKSQSFSIINVNLLNGKARNSFNIIKNAGANPQAISVYLGFAPNSLVPDNFGRNSKISNVISREVKKVWWLEEPPVFKAFSNRKKKIGNKVDETKNDDMKEKDNG